MMVFMLEFPFGNPRVAQWRNQLENSIWPTVFCKEVIFYVRQANLIQTIFGCNAITEQYSRIIEFELSPSCLAPLKDPSSLPVKKSIIIM